MRPSGPRSRAFAGHRLLWIGRDGGPPNDSGPPPAGWEAALPGGKAVARQKGSSSVEGSARIGLRDGASSHGVLAPVCCELLDIPIEGLVPVGLRGRQGEIVVRHPLCSVVGATSLWIASTAVWGVLTKEPKNSPNSFKALCSGDFRAYLSSSGEPFFPFRHQKRQRDARSRGTKGIARCASGGGRCVGRARAPLIRRHAPVDLAQEKLSRLAPGKFRSHP